MTLLKIFIKYQKHTKTDKITQSFKYKNLKLFFCQSVAFSTCNCNHSFFCCFFVVFTSTIKAFLLTAGLPLCFFNSWTFSFNLLTITCLSCSAVTCLTVACSTVTCSILQSKIQNSSSSSS